MRGDAVGGFTYAGNATGLGGTNTLFQSPAGGSYVFTNMEGQGVFPSDQLYRILALRIGLYFRGCAGAVGALALTDHVMYHHAVSQLWWQLEVAQKVAFQAPTSYLPFGGGLFGDVGADTTVYFVNGVPSQAATLVLARSIAIPARQNFKMVNTISAMGGFNFQNDIAGLTAGEVAICACIDGLHVRDIL